MTATSEPNPLRDLVLEPPAVAYIPILAAFDDGPGSWVAWCPLCKRWHFHGDGNGHRRPHCDRERRGRHTFPQPVAFWRHGYVLSDDHPLAAETRVTYRPKMPPLGWERIDLEEAPR